MANVRFNEKAVGVALMLFGFGGLLFSCIGGSGGKNQADADYPSASWEGVSTHHIQEKSSSPSLYKEGNAARTPCRVLTVYDGDTLGCDLDGDGRIRRPEEEIRLLGIDSPEMHYSRKNRTYRSAHPVDEPFAKAASRWLTERAEHRTVYLSFDVRPSDRYGRALAYVYPDAHTPVSLNEEALREGYATTLFLGKNRRYEERFTAVETEARQAGRGLWSEKPE